MKRAIYNNQAKHHVIIFYYLLGSSLISFMIYFYLNFKILHEHPIHWYLFTVTFFYFLYLLYRGSFSFSYDSEGGVLCLKNEDNLLLFKKKMAEFPYEKLLKFYIHKTLWNKELTLIIHSKKSKCKKVKLRYNISYLDDKELIFLIESLTMILHQPLSNVEK